MLLFFVSMGFNVGQVVFFYRLLLGSETKFGGPREGTIFSNGVYRGERQFGN